MKRAVALLYVHSIWKPSLTDVVSLEPMLTDLKEYMTNRAESDIEFLRLLARFLYSSNVSNRLLIGDDYTFLSTQLFREASLHFDKLDLDDLAMIAINSVRKFGRKNIEAELPAFLAKLEEIILSRPWKENSSELFRLV